MARRPSPGRCKSRLAAAIGASAAARVQQRLLFHTQAEAERWMQQSGGTWALALGEQQGAGGLGQRLQRLMGRELRHGGAQIVVVGSDLPGLSAADLQQAFAVLEHQPLVIGPAADGGYWLIGVTAATFAHQRGRLFSGIPWGGDQVLACTLLRAAALALSPVLLRQQHDLDRLSALEPWCGEA